jgi:hypothetical protein
MIIEANCTTGEIIEREPTAAEIAQSKTDTAEAIKVKAAEEADKAAMDAAKAELFARLGITAEEAALLLA